MGEDQVDIITMVLNELADNLEADPSKRDRAIARATTELVKLIGNEIEDDLDDDDDIDTAFDMMGIEFED